MLFSKLKLSALNTVNFQYLNDQSSECKRAQEEEKKQMDDEKDNDISSIAGLESNIKYLEIYENSNRTDKPQGRTLSTIAGNSKSKYLFFIFIFNLKVFSPNDLRKILICF